MKTNSVIKVLAFVLLAFLFLLTTCKKGQDVAKPADKPVEKNPTKDYMEYTGEGLVGAGGGKITLSNSNALNGVSVTIPAGSLSSSTNIKIQVDNSIKPISDKNFDVLKLEPDGLTFTAPITLKIPVSKTISNPVLYYFVPDSMVLLQVPILEFNQTDGYIRAEINHFSRYYIEDNPTKFFDASLYNTGSSIKAKIKFGGQNGLASVPVKLLNIITSGGNILSAKQMIDYGITATINGTFPESFFGNIKVNLLVNTWISKKTLKSVEISIQRKGKDPVKESWVEVRMINPDSKTLFTSGILDSKAKEDFFSGNALVIDFNTPAETGKEYYLEMTWCISDNPRGWWVNRFTNLYSVNTYRDYPPWTISNMISSDLDKNKNFIDDQYDVVPNQAPLTPSNAFPSNFATGISLSPTLSWNCSDPDGDPLTFDVYLGTSSNPTTKVSPNQTTKSYTPSTLTSGVDYYWKVVATDNHSISTTGPVWKFTTFPLVNQPPTQPTSPSPANNATGILVSPTLSWICSDPENDPLTYDIYFGTSSNLTTKVSPDQTAKSYSPTNLTPGTDYYWKIVVKDNKNNSTTSSVWKFTTASSTPSGSVSDADGNTYSTVTIGTQIWMASNLKTTKYNDNSIITLLADNTSWYNLSNVSQPGYCWYNNQISNKDIYGALYNWYAVSTSKLCPTGWHVPSDSEWTTLMNTVGSNSGGKLKETGNSHWQNTNTGTTNAYAFSALPGGYRILNGLFSDIGKQGFWWSSSNNGQLFAWERYVQDNFNGYSDFNRNFDDQHNGYSVRCLKGDSGTLPVNQAPLAPSTENPLNNSTGISTSPTLSWACSDPENDPITYDVYFGTVSNPTARVSPDQTAKNYSPTNLNAGVDYYWKIVAKDNKNNSTTSPVWKFTTVGPISGGSMTDADGNTYSTVVIGTQVWMASNLKTTKYNDGSVIPLVTDNTTWWKTYNPGYCWYNNDAATNKNIYGALYNWYAVSTNRLCPTGWHVPSESEWHILTTYLGGEIVAGSKLKETGTSHWSNFNTDATNITGFTALPGGLRENEGAFQLIGDWGVWWATDPYNYKAACRFMYLENGNVDPGWSLKERGYSVRCLRDY